MRLLLIHHHRRHKANFRAGPFARELARRGHEVTLACTSDRERWKIVERVEDGVHWVEFPDLLIGNARSGWDPWTTVRRIRYFRTRSYDVIHAFETRPATIYPVLSMLKRTPMPLVIDWVDWWGHGGLIAENRPRWWQVFFGRMETYYEEAFRTRAWASTVIAEGLKERAVGLGVPAETIHVLWNGSPVADYPQVKPEAFRGEMGLPLDAFIVCDSGKDVLLGLDVVMRAVAKAAERVPEILFVMTGQGRDRLCAQAHALGLGDRFRHLGFVSNEQLVKALCCADMFVLPFDDRPANRGRWPGKIGKYLATGRPVLTNPVGEMKKLVEEYGVGLLAEATTNAMADGIVQLHANPAQREALGGMARSFAETQLRWEILAGQLEEVYRTVSCEL